MDDSARLSSTGLNPAATLRVLEFQARGVVHYDRLCEQLLAEGRVALAWCRATEALDRAAAA